jgi:hypothetical protein
MRSGLLFILIVFSSGAALSQKLKYKDIQEQLLASDSMTIYPILKAYIKQDTGHAHAHYTLARIFSGMARKSDPLREFKNSVKLSDSALFYFTKCKRLITEKEVKKNSDLYIFLLTEEEKKSKDDEVILLNKIRENIDSQVQFFKNHLVNIRLIFNSFSRASENYAFANTHYVKVNTDFNSLKELYLIADDSLRAELKRISNAYDSSLAQLNLLKKALADYPLKNFNPTYEIKKIETFRLDGLSGSEFLSDKIRLWDYSDWTKNFLKVLDTDIKSLREKIKAEDIKLSMTASALSEGGLIDTFTLHKLDPGLVVLLNKYDFNSFLSNLLEYKEQKNFLLKSQRHPLNSADTCSQKMLSAKMNFLSQYSDWINSCDSILALCVNSDLKKEIRKHGAYLGRSEEGLKKYLEGEAFFVRKEKEENERKYLSFMVNQLNKFSEPNRHFSYNKSDYPLFIAGKNDPSHVTAKFIREDKEGNIYTAGVIRNPASNTSDVYIAMLGKGKTVEWFKTYDLKPDTEHGDDLVTSLELTEEGCVANIFTKNPAASCNTIYRLNKAGKELLTKKIEPKTPARKIIYDELNDNYIAVFKGDSVEENIGNFETISIQFLDLNGMSVRSINKKIKGRLHDVARTSDGFMLIADFKEFEKDDLSIVKSSGNMNILIARINFEGQMVKYKTQEENPTSNYIRVNQQTHLLTGNRALHNVSLLTFSSEPELIRQLPKDIRK